MKDFNRLMLCLDFTEMDKVLIEYLAFICKSHKPSKIYFFHVSKALIVEKELRDKFPELQLPKDEKLESEMREKVAEFFPRVSEFDVEYMVEEGSPFKEVLKWTQIKNIDLLFLGRKSSLKGSGILPQNISRKANCSLLFVTENNSMKFEKIYVPCDFSENSNTALKKALSITDKNPEANTYYHHVFQLPRGYHYTGKTEAEFAEIMRENAEKKYDKMIEKNKHPRESIKPMFSYDEREDPASFIFESAVEMNADLIIMGAKGRTFTTALLLGSVTEKLLRINGQIPTLVVKVKDHNLNILDWFKIA